MSNKTKYIVVLGGNISGLGKGLIASSIAANLEWLGYKVKYQKADPYYNVDPGTMAPTEHGECFVTADGLEADMDLGHFERFTEQDTSRKSSITNGMVYNTVLNKEREGHYLGKTVQMNHLTTEILSQMRERDCDFKIIEIGGTVGDIESNAFLEAIRQLHRKESVSIVELVYVPWLSCSKEWKTKLAQHAVSLTRSMGIEPDVLLARAEKKLPSSVLKKIERFTDIPTYLAEDLDNVYKVPLNLWERGIIKEILNPLDITINGESETNEKYNIWKTRVNKKVNRSVNIGIAGKYENGEESYKSIVEALYHAGTEKGIKVNVNYLDYPPPTYQSPEETGELNIDGIIIPGGFGLRGNEEKIAWLKYTREENIPTFGICLGMQLMCVEYARNVLGVTDAVSEEWNKKGTPIITYMKGQKGKDKGGTMRLGKIRSSVYEGMLKDIYQNNYIYERHRHRLEFMMSTYKKYFHDGDMKIGATSPIDNIDDRLIEAIYLEQHPWYVGSQYHGEFTSRFLSPHPLFIDFVRACNNV